MESRVVGTGSNRVEVESSGVIDAPLDNLWQLLSDFNNVAQWHPDVTESHLESGSGREVGSVRSVRLQRDFPWLRSRSRGFQICCVVFPVPLRIAVLALRGDSGAQTRLGGDHQWT